MSPTVVTGRADSPVDGSVDSPVDGSVDSPPKRPALGGDRPLPRQVAAAGVLVLVAALAVGIGTVVVLAPLVAVLALVAVLGVVTMLAHIERAALAYVAIEPFGDLVGVLHPAAVKVAGVLLFVAWLLRLVLDARPVNLRHPGIAAAAALGLVVLASTVLHAGRNDSGLEVAIRYASYLAVLAVLSDTLRATRAEGPHATEAAVRRMAAVFTLSCTAAGAVGLVGFLLQGGRAAGPLSDANDFAFFLMTAVPLALWLGCGAKARDRLFWLCAVVLVLAVLATFSRGALLGLAAMGALALVLGVVRARAVLVGAAVVLAAVVVTWVSAADVIERSLAEKQHVAAANVDSRFVSWQMAAAMTAHSPLLGQGPGGFADQGAAFTPAHVTDTRHLDVAHQMYLDVASELGLLGLGAFGAVIVSSARGAWRARRECVTAGGGTACLVAFCGVLLAACFLTEQYYLPVWLLAAFGIALDPLTPSRKGA
ncbi:O-antigen ligase family protein [Nocardioides sp. zg-ZUI104]|uniref:O-antigen ligase family protein n=1 Tax=Nocardioides faecalis TaxID=2803858 RepID=UPI001BCE1DA1|nr:O-antigen ligase family protein [Nocardioides faecalis]MBS4753714.1 O-antigen ligase family protein [Nocardioides faecalis]